MNQGCEYTVPVSRNYIFRDDQSFLDHSLTALTYGIYTDTCRI